MIKLIKQGAGCSKFYFINFYYLNFINLCKKLFLKKVIFITINSYLKSYLHKII